MVKLRYHSIHGKFSQSLGYMAASSEPLAKRLENVMLSYLLPLKVDEFPKDLQESFQNLISEATRLPAEFKDEGSLHATLRQMSPRKARRLIEEIASIEYALSQHHYE